MKTIAVCALVAASFVVALGGGASATPKNPLHCHMVPGTCVTKTITCPPPGQHVNANNRNCHPTNYKTCAPPKKVCD